MRRGLTALIAAGMLLGTMSVARAQADHEVGHDGGHSIERQFAALRAATAPYHRLSTALADGYSAFTIPTSVGGKSTVGLGLPGDPSCFDSASGGMGVHYVKGIDGTVDASHPEALVYAIGEHGRLQLVAVEYIVPDSLVDPNNMPMLFGQMFHHHPYLPVYILHVWAWKHNPNGMFADWNPRVGACPTPTS